MNKNPSFIIDHTRQESSLWITNPSLVKRIYSQIKYDQILFEGLLIQKSRNGGFKEKYFLFTDDYVMVKNKKTSTKIRQLLNYKGLRLSLKEEESSIKFNAGDHIFGETSSQELDFELSSLSVNTMSSFNASTMALASCDDLALPIISLINGHGTFQFGVQETESVSIQIVSQGSEPESQKKL